MRKKTVLFSLVVTMEAYMLLDLSVLPRERFVFSCWIAGQGFENLGLNDYVTTNITNQVLHFPYDLRHGDMHQQALTLGWCP